MNEWGFINQDIFEEIGKSAIIPKFNSKVCLCGRREISAF